MRRLRNLIYALVAACCLGGGGAAIAATTASADVNTVSATTSVTNHPDSGLHGNWAIDTYTRMASVTSDGLQVGNPACDGLSPCYQYTGTLSDNGTFAAAGGNPSPEAGVAINGPVTGSFSGGGVGSFTFYATSATPSNTGVPVSLNGPPPPADTTTNWMTLFFPATTEFVGSFPAAWSWSYHDALNCQTWVNAAAGNTGDITGVDHCVTTLTDPGNQATPVNTSVSLQMHASTTSSDKALTYSMTGQPGGLTINPVTGLITGKPTAVENTDVVTVTAADFGGVAQTVTFGWTVTASVPPPPVASKLVAADVCGPSTGRHWKISNVAGGRTRAVQYFTLVNGAWHFDGSTTVAAGKSVIVVTHVGSTFRILYGNGLGAKVISRYPVTTTRAC